MIDILILKTMLLPRIFFRRLSGLAQAKSCFHFIPFVFFWKGFPTWYTMPTCSHPSMDVRTHTHTFMLCHTPQQKGSDVMTVWAPSHLPPLMSPPPLSQFAWAGHACLCLLSTNGWGIIGWERRKRRSEGGRVGGGRERKDEVMWHRSSC